MAEGETDHVHLMLFDGFYFSKCANKESAAHHNACL